MQPLVGDLVLTWDSVSGWPTVGDFIIRLDHPNNGTTEYVLCTSVNVGANQTTVTRAQESTSASGGFIVGSTGANAFTKKMYDDSVVRLDTSLSQTLTGPLAIPTALGAAPAATSYGTVPLKFAETLLGAGAATVTFSSIPSSFRNLTADVNPRSDTAAAFTNFNVRVNNDSTANYDADTLFATTAFGTPIETLAGTLVQLMAIPAASAAAGLFGAGHLRIPNYSGTVANKIGIFDGFESRATTTGNQLRWWSGFKWRTVGTALNRLDFSPTAGNLITGCLFVIGLEP